MNLSAATHFDGREMLRAIRSGIDISDDVFDLVYAEDVRKLSDIHWTPVSVARRAAQLLVRGPGSRILDVGSGCGKFCLVGSLTTNGHFTGVEQRRPLALAGYRIASDYGIDRIEFLLGDLRAVEWRNFDGFYLYNPFGENLYPKRIRIDRDVELTERRYYELVRLVQMRLHLLPIGTRVATFHGFGGEMPPGYAIRASEARCGGELVLWEKTEAPPALG